MKRSLSLILAILGLFLWCPETKAQSYPIFVAGESDKDVTPGNYPAFTGDSRPNRIYWYLDRGAIDDGGGVLFSGYTTARNSSNDVVYLDEVVKGGPGALMTILRSGDTFATWCPGISGTIGYAGGGLPS